MRRLLSFLIKAAISALLLYLSLRRVDLSHVGQRLSDVDWSWIAAVLVLMAVQVALNAWRWREIVGVCYVTLRTSTALGYSFIGQFFSQVLPSTIGGDAVRMWLLARGGAGWPASRRLRCRCTERCRSGLSRCSHRSCSPATGS